MTPAHARDPRGSDSVRSRHIAGILREEILAGELTPGTWLRQDDIAARLGTSRIPVREALRILESDGLAESFPNRGSRVPMLSLQEVNTYYRMRERLEPLTLIESLPHLADQHIDRLEQLQDEIESQSDVNRFLLLDREFHMTTYAGCPSEHLLAITERLWNSTQHYRRAFMVLTDPDRGAIVNAEHRLILDAVRRRDPEDGERYLTGHIRRTRVELTAHPELFTDKH
ncbi:GntR family transcriptional regulator [Actinacidiphila glaucinigra]|uniref:Transcriptional regulator, GntR family n=1 Tax=Actinacidiphila glaucinigra TaxID=235986 RepID=A0A239NSD1_9ACTN|nr:GntR family transcriptional regulator [Actinacidiphila glaucinigra]SNT57765.1 transcriptional regulator, GntR family [Actinacidiphila glaucinigra]